MLRLTKAFLVVMLVLLLASQGMAQNMACPSSKTMSMGNMCCWNMRKCSDGSYFLMPLTYCGDTVSCPGTNPPCISIAGEPEIDCSEELAMNGYKNEDLLGGNTRLSGTTKIVTESGASVTLLDRFREKRPDVSIPAPLNSEHLMYVKLINTDRDTEMPGKQPYIIRLAALQLPDQKPYGDFGMIGWEVESAAIPDAQIRHVKWSKPGAGCKKMGFLKVTGHRKGVKDDLTEMEEDATYKIPFVLWSGSADLP